MIFPSVNLPCVHDSRACWNVNWHHMHGHKKKKYGSHFPRYGGWCFASIMWGYYLRWCYGMEMLSTLLALCEGNPPVILVMWLLVPPHIGPVMIAGPLWGESHWSPVDALHIVLQRLDVFSVVRLNNHLNKQSSCLWFEMPWHLCDVTVMWYVVIGQKSWWLQMPWCQIDARISASIVRTPLWMLCRLCHIMRHIFPKYFVIKYNLDKFWFPLLKTSHMCMAPGMWTGTAVVSNKNKI